jgi:hypothetical protein
VNWLPARRCYIRFTQRSFALAAQLFAACVHIWTATDIVGVEVVRSNPYAGCRFDLGAAG